MNQNDFATTNAGANGDNDRDPGRLTQEDLTEIRERIAAEGCHCEEDPEDGPHDCWQGIAQALLDAAERTQKAEAERDALRESMFDGIAGDEWVAECRAQQKRANAALARVAELEAEVDGWRSDAYANDKALIALGSKWSSRNATLRARVAELEAEVERLRAEVLPCSHEAWETTPHQNGNESRTCADCREHLGVFQTQSPEEGA